MTPLALRCSILDRCATREPPPSAVIMQMSLTYQHIQTPYIVLQEGDAVGASATFECEVSPSTAVTTWMKDDSNLRESPKHKFTSDGKDRRLAIIDVQLSDTGEYTCVAKLGNKEKTTTAKLIVEVPPRVELGVDMKNMIIVKAGENVSFDAVVFGKPLPKVTWKRNGVPLKLVEGMKMTQKRHTHILELFSVARKESGEYTILAENPNGAKYANIKLKVLGMQNYNFEPPVITNITANSMTVTGTTVELRFGIIAKPAPTIEWYKDRKELESGAQAQLVQKNAADSSTLIIRDTTHLNSGTYEMRLKNSLGSAYAYVRVQILGTYCSLSFLFWYLYGTYMSTLLAQYRKSYGKLLMESYSIVNSQYSIVTQYL
uniref:Ig-like domain-containing protein n=1 Tax=Oncorhynchus mykiss TaxID=8022 RepID=A0A8K9UX21_ONCMY